MRDFEKTIAIGEKRIKMLEAARGRFNRPIVLSLAGGFSSLLARGLVSISSAACVAVGVLGLILAVAGAVDFFAALLFMRKTNRNLPTVLD